MNIRTVTLAYVVPPLLASVLAFLGLVQVSEAGLVGASAVITAAAGVDTASNQRVAHALQRVAEAEDATIVRVVADREAPTTRRTALVTDAPSSLGAGWLDDGYGDFSRSMSTRVRPMTDLDHFDPVGSYAVFGDDAARRAVLEALADLGYDVTAERLPFLRRIGVSDGFSGTSGLVGALTLGCVILCMMGTLGAPRRSAVRRLHGRSTASVVLDELSEIRATLLTIAVGTPVVTVGLWSYNGLASAAAFATATVVIGTALLVPIITAHSIGTVLACRQPLPTALRGARPAGALVFAAQVARVPALLLLVTAVFDLTGAVATVRSGSAERDLRAAGASVQLWVTPDPRPVDSQRFWDRIGAFAGKALEQRDALLAATVEVASGHGKSTVPALFVDPGYLGSHDVRADDGSRIAADGSRISVWIPAGDGLDRGQLVGALVDWQLREATLTAREQITGGRLAPQQVYTYPDDSSTRPWLADPVIVVVPEPAEVFSADQLGSWLSTGDVVFRDRAAAERSIAASDVRGEFSAVVAVGQVAAEQARLAAAKTVIATATVTSTLVVNIALGMLGTVAHRRRHGRALFAKLASGVSAVRADAALLVIESILVSIAVVVTVNSSWSARPDGSGRNSVLDPVAQSAATAGALALLAVAVVSAINGAVLAATARNTLRNRGNEAR